MPFARKNPDAPRPVELSLIEQTEKLVTSMVRHARSGRTITDSEGKRKKVPHDMMDQLRAADAALKFLQIKAKLDVEPEEGEFERAQRDYHGQRDGPPDRGEEPDNPNGRATATH